MKQKILLFVFFCGGIVFACKPKQPDSAATAVLPVATVEQTIRDFSAAVQAKDTAAVRNAVAPHFAVATKTMPASLHYLQTILTYEPVDSIVPLAGQPVAVAGSFKQKALAMVHAGGRAPVKTGVTFDGRNGKILYVDYLDARYGMFRDRPAQLAAVLPIEQEPESGSIIVSLKLNNYSEPLRFLFDSGADGMAITPGLAAKAGVKASHAQSTSVVGGNMQITVSSGNTVHLDTLQLPNQNMAIFENIRQGVDGIIGLNLATNYIVRVNFDEQKMYLYTFGAYTYEAEGETESVQVPGGVIHIPGYLSLTGKDTVRGNFVFDTGAAYSLMAFSAFVRNNRLLLSGFKPEGQTATMSMGIVTPVYEGTAKSFGVGENIRQTDMPVSLQASTGNSSWAPNVDGSMGIKLISRYNFTINLVEKEIHFAPRNAE